MILWVKIIDLYQAFWFPIPFPTSRVTCNLNNLENLVVWKIIEESFELPFLWDAHRKVCLTPTWVLFRQWSLLTVNPKTHFEDETELKTKHKAYWGKKTRTHLDQWIAIRDQLE